jgi:hypothetical protein
MTVREPSYPEAFWPIRAGTILLGLLILFGAPYYLAARNVDDQRPSPAPKQRPIALAAPEDQKSDLDRRLRTLEDKMERVLRALESQRPASGEKRRIVASGNPVTKEVKVANFTRVAVGHTIQVEITRADAFHVAVTASDNLHEHIRIVKDEATLKIGMDPEKNYQSHGEPPIKVTITMPTLEGVTVSGASRMTINGFKPKEFQAKLSGASRLEGVLESEKVTLDATGASRLTLTGSAKEGQLAATGASNLRLADFALASAVVNLTGASSATVRTTGSLTYTVSGASHLKYLDNPKVLGKKVGASSVSHQ